MPRKPLDIVANVLATALLAFAVCLAVFAVATTISSGRGEASLFGWRPFIVMSDSMRGVFDVGDVAVSREVDPSEIEPGDIVTFRSADPDSFDEVVTHKVRAIVEHEGAPALVTYGVATGDDDPSPVALDRVVGEYAFRIPKAGYAFEFLKSPAGYVALVLVPFGLIIVLQARRLLRLLREGRTREPDAPRPVDPADRRARAAILRDLPAIVLEPPKRG